MPADNYHAAALLTIERCRKLATFSEEDGATTRTFLAPQMHDCHRQLSRWLEPLGAEIRIDNAGNFHALYPASAVHAPRLLIGSHLDTVPNAGAFDGILGVVVGIALVESLHADPRNLPFAMEIIGFSEEEGVRFGIPFIGSRALAGQIDAELLARKDSRGISVKAAIESFGLDPADLANAHLTAETIGYLEFHIEQGPVLEEMNLPLAAVGAIAGQTRMEFTFTGRANHAGTTPMHLRRDALAGAAEWIGAVEEAAGETPSLVATVGQIESKPGATNVIAETARASLDVRHRDDPVRAHAVSKLLAAAKEIAVRRNLSLKCKTLLEQSSVPMDARLTEIAEKAIECAGRKPHRITSGAGHDAMVLAQRVPAAMIFLRSPGGISHSPEERVEVEDVAKALETGAHFLDLLAASRIIQRGASSKAAQLKENE
ncbi:MAG TPA: allantoate amidohydrolase [Candidatus Aquilonibacter sp.]|nr:allantoate amidohydrolase [Candidatus Aquilonibacter sp.]